MGSFEGFPDGAIAATPIPKQFFADLLPQIGSLAELKVTLHVLWRTSAGARAPAWLTMDQLLREGLLLDGLAGEPGGALAAIREGARRAIERGTLLQATIAFADAERIVVVPNTGRGRRELGRLREQAVEVLAPTPGPATGPTEQRPGIFQLYEDNVGLVQPLIAEELRAAAQLYPPVWIEDAFRQAVAYNRRNWRYIKRILERWATEGRDADASARDRVAGNAHPASKRRWVQTYRPGERLPDL